MTDKKQNTLVILTPGFPSGEDDTSCLPHIQVFVRSLAEAYPSIKIMVLTFQYPFKREKYKWFGVDVVSFNGRRRGKLFRLFTWFKVWSYLKSIIRNQYIIGLLGLWLGECSFVGKRFAVKYGLKHYSYILGQDAKKGNRYVSMIKPDAERLIALSDFLAAELDKNYGIRPRHIIPPGINTAYFPEKLFERNIDILGVGSLIGLKRFDVFIRIVKSLSLYLPYIKTVICGKGSELGTLKRMIRENDLTDNIQMIEGLPHNEVLMLMKQSKILLHPSSYEGFGMVCLEALYAGAKVVSFSRPMNDYIENWYVVKDESQMIEQLVELLETELVHEPSMPFSISVITKSVMELFDQ